VVRTGGCGGQVAQPGRCGAVAGVWSLISSGLGGG
jgi:hypothetical protein